MAFLAGGTATNLGAFASMHVFVFLANTTYTPTANMTFCIIEAIGGGGGGGGATADALTGSASGSGGAGGYARLLASAATIGASQAIVIGGGGNGGNATSNGTDGGTTSVGSLITCTGGLGGALSGANTVTTVSAGGAGGTATGGNINITGMSGSNGVSSATTVIPAQGATSPYGNGAHTAVNGGSPAAFAAGAGGAGVAAFQNVTGQAGSAGRVGQVIITEFIV